MTVNRASTIRGWARSVSGHGACHQDGCRNLTNYPKVFELG